jgi:Tfp pilus assembly protein PilX
MCNRQFGISRPASRRGSARQRGAVLIVGLVMLTVMTMLVVSMLRTSIIDLKIGGISQDAQVNFNNAEIALTTYANANAATLSHNCIVLNLCNIGIATPPVVAGGTVTYTAWQAYCGDKPGFTGNQVGSSYQSVVIDVIADGTTVLGSSTRLHLGMAQDLAPGGCSI